MSHHFNNGSCVFTVWAPEKERMILHLVDAKGKGTDIPMQKDDTGYFRAEAGDVRAGDLYFYRPDDQSDYPDPESYFQPRTGKLRDRHQLDRVNAHCGQLVQAGNDCDKATLRCKRPDVQLVKNEVFEWQSLPIVIIPGVPGMVNYSGRAVDTTP